MPGDHFNLERFVEAQDRGTAFEQALEELRQGRKRGHWIWFVFPQIQGLGSSETARFYAISSLAEATEFYGGQHDPATDERLAGSARD